MFRVSIKSFNTLGFFVVIIRLFLFPVLFTVFYGSILYLIEEFNLIKFSIWVKTNKQLLLEFKKKNLIDRLKSAHSNNTIKYSTFKYISLESADV